MARSVVGALRVTLGLDSAQFETGIRRAGKSTQDFARSTRTIETAAASATGVLRGLASAVGLLGVGAAARGFLSLADQSKQLTAQLRLATAESGSFAKAQEDVRRISEVSRAGLQETGTLYGSFIRTSQELGATQQQAAVATETFTKALKIGGAGTAQVQSATLQMGQALASSNVQWEELGQILEASPRLAKVFTDSLGVTRQELKKMAEDGKLSGEMLFNALNDRDIVKKINAEFRQLPVTFDEAMTQIHSAATITFGAFDQGGEFSTALANFILGGTTGFKELERGAEDMGISVRASIEGLAGAFGPVFDEAEHFFAYMKSGMGDVSFDPARELRDVDRATEWLSSGETALEQWINKALWGQKSGRTNFEGRYVADRDNASQRFRGRAAERGVTNIADKMGLDRFGNPVREPSARAPRAGSGDKTKGPKGPSAETLRKRAEAEAERAADALRRFTDELAREQADLSEAMARLSGNTDALADAEVAKIEADREAREREINDRERISDAQRQQLIDLNDQNADAQKQAVRKRQIEQEIERADRIAIDRLGLESELLQLSSDLARTAKERRNVELRILDNAFEQERIRLEGIKATAAVNSAEWAYANARLAKIDELKGGATAQVLRQTQGPMESFLDSLPQSAEEAQEAIERIQVDGINGLIDGLSQASLSIKGLGDMFKNVANQIIQDLIRIQIRKAMVGALSSVLGLGGGGGLGINAGAASAGASYDFSAIPGFATGGSFKVGGSSSVGDQNLVMFRANAGEMVDVRKPGNDTGGGRAMHFDLRGAVMTQDLLDQMNQMATGAAMTGGNIGSAGAQVAMARQQSRMIP